MTSITDNLTEIKKQIKEWETAFSRPLHSVSLLAVSKEQPLAKITEAIAAGQYAFGENHLQEALPKIAALTDKNLEWHFIGLIQHNKIKKIAEHFQWVHSVTDSRIAQSLNDRRSPWLPPLNICLEVNMSGNPGKQGVSLTEIEKLAEYCMTLPRLTLRGLMTIPLPQISFEAQRKEFAALKTLFNQLNQKSFKLDTLSMGMSADMKAAIAEGATIVRIGTAIFGARES